MVCVVNEELTVHIPFAFITDMQIGICFPEQDTEERILNPWKRRFLVPIKSMTFTSYQKFESWLKDTVRQAGLQ